MVPPPAPIAQETSLSPRAGTDGTFGWLVRLCLEIFDTVEVCGSSPHGPTIFFSELASTTFFGQAPIGSIKEVVRDSEGSSRLWARTVEKDAPASAAVSCNALPEC